MRWTEHERRCARARHRAPGDAAARKLTVRETLRLFRSFTVTDARSTSVAPVAARAKTSTWAWASCRAAEAAPGASPARCAPNPTLLFLDEPTTGLDPQSRRSFGTDPGAAGEGQTIVLTTHYMDEAERLCDRVAVVDRGKIIALGTPNKLIARMGGSHVVWFESEPALAADSVAHVASVEHTRKEATGVSLTVDALHVALPALLAHIAGQGATLTALSSRHATLEDVFVSLTGRHLRDE